MLKKTLRAFSVILFLFAFSSSASAATLSVSLTADTFAIGDSFDAKILIDSQGAGINAAQTTLRFPTNILQVVAIKKTDSVFSFWLTEPTFSNADGTVTFVAGSASGFVGPSLNALTVTFKAKGTGTGDLVFNSSVITISDGSGANVLSDTKVSKVTVSTQGTVTPTTPTAVPPPTQITRPAVPAENLPARPALVVPLYPDPAKWYNLSSIFLASWTLPADVADVATAVDKDPASRPTVSEGLFDNKVFTPLDNGVWYLHVRFKNSVGWGTTAHYRLAIDTTPPVPFEVKISEGSPTDAPAPTLNYPSADQLSGLGNYSIRVDNGDLISVGESMYILPLLAPGKHMVRVDAQDQAGNITEDLISLEILPIEGPRITSVNKDVFIGEGGININGSSLPSIAIILNIRDEKNNPVYSATISADGDGNWVAKLDQPLKKGNYFVEVIAQDARGALSLPVRSDLINVRSKPLVVLLGIEITAVDLVFLLLFILVGAYFLGWRISRRDIKRRDQRILISQRDVAATRNVIKTDIDKAISAWRDGKVEEREVNEIEYLLKRVEGNLDKLEKYIIKGVKEINK